MALFLFGILASATLVVLAVIAAADHDDPFAV